jgi:hypothetical protein
MMANVDMQYVTINTVEDLEAVPRGCILGRAFIDKDSKVHGCCYSSTGEQSPFSPIVEGNSMKENFEQMESSPLFQIVMKNGFLDSLSPAGKQLLVDRVRGQRFGTECDLCVNAMKKDTDAIWRECLG